MSDVSTVVQDEPVFVAMNGLGLLATATLGLLALIGSVDIEPLEIAKLGAAVQLLVNALAAVIRPFVTPNGKVIESVPSVQDKP
jgi:stage V sporulation protein SpoVS